MADEREDSRNEEQEQEQQQGRVSETGYDSADVRDSMMQRARKRAMFYEGGQRKSLGGKVVNAVKDDAARMGRRASAVASVFEGTPIGDGLTASANAGKKAAQKVGDVAGKAPGVAKAGVDKAKAGVGKVRAGAAKVDEKLPGHKQREWRREDKRAEKEARKAEKAQKAADKRMRGWNAGHYDEGSAEHQKYLDELCFHIMDEQKSFVQYTTDMTAWRSKREASKEMDERNEMYCRNMFDYCISPLQHGISPETVVDTIGLYVGMSILSKDFRENIGSELKRMMLPVQDRIGSLSANYKDREVARNVRKAEAIMRRFGGEPSALEQDDPPHPTPRWARPKVKWAEEYLAEHYTGENADKHAAKMKLRADEITMAKNHGRLPLTPETAALQKLNLMHNYYVQSRDPKYKGEEGEKQLVELEKDYKGAMDMLKTLMKDDKVDVADMNKEFRSIVGQLTAVYPEYEREFSGLAYDNVVRSDGVAVERPSPDSDDIMTCYAWHGEYEWRDTGKAYDGSFDVRAIQDQDEHIQNATKSIKSIYSKLDTADKMFAALNSSWIEKARMRYLSMMESDFAALDVRKPLDRPRDAESCVDQCFRDAMEDWMFGDKGKAVGEVQVTQNGKPVMRTLYENNHYDEAMKLHDMQLKQMQEERQRSGRNANFGEFDVEDSYGDGREMGG